MSGASSESNSLDHIISASATAEVVATRNDADADQAAGCPLSGDTVVATVTSPPSSSSQHQLRKRHSPTSTAGTSVKRRDSVQNPLTVTVDSSGVDGRTPTASAMMNDGSDQATADFSKMRKLSSSASSNNTGVVITGVSNNEESSKAGRSVDGSSARTRSPRSLDEEEQQAANASNASGIPHHHQRHSRLRQLKHLTDYFPDQLSSGESRLTRSKTSQKGQTSVDVEKAAMRMEGNDGNLASQIDAAPLSPHSSKASSGHSHHRKSPHTHRHYAHSLNLHPSAYTPASDSTTTSEHQASSSRKVGFSNLLGRSASSSVAPPVPPPMMSVPLPVSNHPVVAQPMHIAGSGVLQFAPPLSHYMSAAPNLDNPPPPLHSLPPLPYHTPMPYEMSGGPMSAIPPQAIMSLHQGYHPTPIGHPPPQQQRQQPVVTATDLTNFASRLAAAVVVGGSGVATGHQAAVPPPAFFGGGPPPEFIRHPHHHHHQLHATGSGWDPMGLISASSSIGISRVVGSAGSAAAAMGGVPHSSGSKTNAIPSSYRSSSTTSTSTSSLFGLRPQHPVHRATSFLGSLVPKMQHLLSSSSGSSGSHSSGGNSSNSGGTHVHHSNGRVMSILEGLKSSNEIRQAEAAKDLAEMLLLGNEDNLPHMPMRDIINALMSLLQKDHNFDLMLTAARCITNLQEALPRALPLITDAIPLLLQKLKRIEYIEIAEQSLIALEVMSRRNARNILNAGGIGSTISHVDFFSLPSQRLAFQVAANCASYVGQQEFPAIRDSCLSDLNQRLKLTEDKRCIESICTFFNRLIENMRHHPDRLREIAGVNYDFLKSAQHLLTTQPSTIGSGTFLHLLRSMRYMCARCGDIAVALIGMDVGRTIRFLLVGPERVDISSTSATSVDATGHHRPLPQLREIIELIGELMPTLPDNELFEVTAALNQYMTSTQSSVTTSLSHQYAVLSGSSEMERSLEQLIQHHHHQRSRYPFEVASVSWHVRDEDGEWRACSAREGNLLEQSRLGGESSTMLEMDGEAFEVDFDRMVRRNQRSGSESPLDRRVSAIGGQPLYSPASASPVIPSSSSASSKGISCGDGGASASLNGLERTTRTSGCQRTLDKRDELKRSRSESFLELISMLFPLLVDLGTTSTCSSIRYETLRVMTRAICAVETEEDLKAVLHRVPLAVFISSLLSTSNRSLGVTVSVLQIVHLLLDKLGPTYIPLLESEGVFHEIEKLAKMPSTNTTKTGITPEVRSGSSSTSTSSSATRRFTRASGGGGDGSRHAHFTRGRAAAAAAASTMGESPDANNSRMEVDEETPTSVASSSSYHRYRHHQPELRTHSSSTFSNPPPYSSATITPHDLLMAAHVHGAFPDHLQAMAGINLQQSPAAASYQLPPPPPHMTHPPPPIAIPPVSFAPPHSGATSQQLVNDALAASTANALNLPISSIVGASPSSASSATKQAIVQRLQEFVRSESKRLLEIYENHHQSTNEARHGEGEGAGSPSSGRDLIRRLKRVAQVLKTEGTDVGMEALVELCGLIMENESLSAFQLNHSGVVSALNEYLTSESTKLVPERSLRLKRFLATFTALTAETAQQPKLLTLQNKSTIAPFERLIVKVILVIGQLEQFQVRVTNLGAITHPGGSGSSVGGGASGMSIGAMAVAAAALGGSTSALASLAAASSSSASSSSTTYLRGAQALRFFQANQIKCNLKRHPACKNLREWRHGRGTIKVDPFTSVGSIERYLIDKGIGLATGAASSSGGGTSGGSGGVGGDDSSEDISDEEHDELLQSSQDSTRTTYRGRIDLYLGENRLSTDMSILQAIRQYAILPSVEREHDDVGGGQHQESSIPSYLWFTSHTLYYRSASTSEGIEDPTAAVAVVGDGDSSLGSASPSSSTATRASSDYQPSAPSWSLRRSGGGEVGTSASSSSRTATSPPSRKMPRIGGSRVQTASGSSGGNGKRSEKYSTNITKDSRVYKEGRPPKRPCPLDRYLSTRLDREIEDPSTGTFLLLKALYGLNNYWWVLFTEEVLLPDDHDPILPANTFHSHKLNSKVTRQLSDFLSVATQQIPKWTIDLIRAIPFAFPFQTRRALLYCTAFGRDRALMHLVSESDEHDGQQDPASRLIPRLERKKVTVSRSNLLKEAQQAMSQLGSSKAMLEVGFDGEVGTGYGPTMEFYSTISRELQRHALKLWHGRPQQPVDDGGGEITAAENGLYPNIYRPPSGKQMEARLKKFEFIGRLLGQALIDSKILDLPFASPFFKWLLGEEEQLGVEDLERLDPAVYRSLVKMSAMAEDDFDNLDLYFTFPHSDNAFEMTKGGKSEPVTGANLEKFVGLVSYWRLVEGVRPEMEAVRRGFDTVIDSDSLRIFFPDEMELLFCGQSRDDGRIWSRSVLQQHIRPDHGFHHDSPQIAWLIEWLHTADGDKRRRFLQFVTGSPRLPVGGFRALNPPLTVVRKTASYCGSENELPSAMTCYNYLKIPPYESYAIFAERFEVALQFIYSFHLT